MPYGGRSLKPFCRIPIVQREGPTSCTPDIKVLKVSKMYARSCESDPRGLVRIYLWKQNGWFVGGAERTVGGAVLEQKATNETRDLVRSAKISATQTT